MSRKKQRIILWTREQIEKYSSSKWADRPWVVMSAPLEANKTFFFFEDVIHFVNKAVELNKTVIVVASDSLTETHFKLKTKKQQTELAQMLFQIKEELLR